MKGALTYPPRVTHPGQVRLIKRATVIALDPKKLADFLASWDQAPPSA